jgi:hypothetical protein
MNFISRRLGLSTISKSTLFVDIVISGASVIKFISKICFGNNGRNGRNSDAPAMLNIFPKFALVAIKTYFNVLANVRLPSSTPFANTANSFSSNTKSAASFTTSAALSTDILASAA